MMLLLNSQCTISSFSLGGTTCLAYILFNDSGNSSPFNHFFNRYVCTFPAHFSALRLCVYLLRRHPLGMLLLFHLVNHIFKELQIVVPIIYNQVKALQASILSSMDRLSYQLNVSVC